VHFYYQPPGENPAQAARKSVGFLSGLCDIAAMISLIAAGLGSSCKGCCFDGEGIFRSLASRKARGSIKLLPKPTQGYTLKLTARNRFGDRFIRRGAGAGATSLLADHRPVRRSAVSHESSRVDKCDAASSATLPAGGVGRSHRIIVSTRRDSACSIQRVGIAIRMIRPSSKTSCIKTTRTLPSTTPEACEADHTYLIFDGRSMQHARVCQFKSKWGAPKSLADTGA